MRFTAEHAQGRRGKQKNMRLPHPLFRLGLAMTTRKQFSISLCFSVTMPKMHPLCSSDMLLMTLQREPFTPIKFKAHLCVPPQPLRLIIMNSIYKARAGLPARALSPTPVCFRDQFFTKPLTKCVVTDLGLSMGAPRALLHISCAPTPKARDTPNITV
jgi:hypothetical protein